jgi:hypothetical protein
MRNRRLHDALRDFALEAAALLTQDLRTGAEIPFDVVEEPGAGTVLYRYQPLTTEFVAQRWTRLRELPAFATAAGALGSGAETYLRMQATGADADSEPALCAMLERLYQDATSFEFPEDRFERVYDEVERALYENTIRTAVIAPLHGVELEQDRVDIGEGMFLIAGDKLDAPPGAVWSDASGQVERDGPPNVLCVLRRDIAADEPLPVGEARVRFRKLLTALRLFKPGGVSFGPVGWGRVDEGAWTPLPLGLNGPARGGPWTLHADEQAEFVELVELVLDARPGGRIAWSMSRFEMGCERPLDTEALSDYLLALESLLDAADEAGRASLILRLAALCAEEDERKAVQRRLELAFALERWVMGGGGANAYLEALGPDTPRSLVLELEHYVRALLRDVLCGYLSADLKTTADDLLLASSEPLDIRARDLREGAAGRGSRVAGPVPEPFVEEEPQLVIHDVPPPPPPPAAFEESPPPPTARDPRPDPYTAPEEQELPAGVTPSADWDDDPASYSAPI